jgi:hypothetical protein
VYINKNFIAPIFLSIGQNHNTSVNLSDRRINIKLDGFNSPRGFGIPFGGYFWLPFSFFIATRQELAIKILTTYHLFLGIVPPFFALLFINKIVWAGMGLKINETLFQGMFLIFLFFGFKKILDQYRKIS